MKLVELLNAANRGFPDGFLTEYYDIKTGKLKDGSGDTLAQFLVRELAETFDERESSDFQINTAIGIIDCAMRDLELVAAALEEWPIGEVNRP
jgi:hypothetical protein